VRAALSAAISRADNNVQELSGRVTRLENSLYVRLDGVVTTRSRAFGVGFTRTTLGATLSK
jgi:hypothetical protein